MLLRDSGHWDREDHKQRMATKDWRKMLLADLDRLIVKGRLRQLIGIYIGAGVYEVSKKPLEE
jgi:hypothetical protein